ncbi:hypothetical protein BC629DRAFT_1525155, partial [Irpex lacteus]
MMGELETAEAEKQTMIEDCRNTRDERDEARKRCEDLESWHVANYQRESEATSIVRAVVDACVKRQLVSSSFARAATKRLSG